MAKTKKYLRKRKKRQAKKGGKLASPSLANFQLRQARSWALFECRVNAEWQDTMQISQLCVARRSPLGEIAAGIFLVDLACLGVKNAYATIFHSESAYRKELLSRLSMHQSMVTCELDLVAKIVAEAVNYAAGLGFKPHKDIKQALLVMGEAHPENCTEAIPTGGPEGKPFFVNGPYDDVDRVLRILDRHVGQGNYHFLMQMGDPFLDEFEDDMDEDWEEE